MNIDFGAQVQQLLISLGLENKIHSHSREATKAAISSLLISLGLDISQESIQDTPIRVAAALIDELFYGLYYENFPQILLLPVQCPYLYPITTTNISFNSTCEHHLLSVNGLATVSYIPNNTLIGLSKVNRIVDFFAKRPQLQERATQQIAYSLMSILATTDVAVKIAATHQCLTIRGIADAATQNISYHLSGQFLDIYKDYFLQL